MKPPEETRVPGVLIGAGVCKDHASRSVPEISAPHAKAGERLTQMRDFSGARRCQRRHHPCIDARGPCANATCRESCWATRESGPTPTERSGDAERKQWRLPDEPRVQAECHERQDRGCGAGGPDGAKAIRWRRAAKNESDEHREGDNDPDECPMTFRQISPGAWTRRS